MRSIHLEPRAVRDLQEWLPYPKMIQRIFEMFTAMQRTPFDGLGKSEPLKHKLHGC
jgi:toxin YoeB